MTRPEAGCLVQSLARAARVVFAAAFLIGASYRTVLGQATGGYDIESVEMWIQGKASAEREWNSKLSQRGILFHLDAENEARLRRAAASPAIADEWITMLRRVKFVGPEPVSAPAPNPAPTPRSDSFPTRAPRRRSFSRDELRPIYFGRDAHIEAYVDVAQLTETGGAVGGQFVQSANGPIAVQSAPLAPSPLMYGIIVDYQGIGLDVQGYFQQRNLMMLNLGVTLTPFIPIGTTGFRIIAGVTPFLGITRQIIGNVRQAASDTASTAIELLNNVYGGDVRAGLAFHWRPGAWVYVEARYRIATTYSRELRVPGEPVVSDGMTWSNWAARGGMLRLGAGF
jgi:hypothetical protein